MRTDMCIDLSLSRFAQPGLGFADKRQANKG